jgi:alpha-amylase
MQGTKVILGTYNSMPEGCSDSAFESTYQRSWRPFLSSLNKFHNVNAVLFYSGTVYRWIEENHPEFLLLLVEMHNRKQVEILGGGFYSPLFETLQVSDKIGQIEMLTTYIRRTFGKRPSGGWLYEYSWDTSLPPVFRNAGFGYTFLPVSRLEALGFCFQGEVNPFITEEQRKTLTVIPCFDLGQGNSPMRPFEDSLEYYYRIYPAAPLFALMLDGNSVPKMWESSGLESPDVLFEKTFAWFQKNCLDFETVSAQAFLKNSKTGPLRYFSYCASDRLAKSIEGDRSFKGQGIPSAPGKQLVSVTKTSKRLYDKMCYIHSLMTVLRGDKARKKSAQEDLWSAQSGDAYWQGAYGGIRRPEVRIHAYRALIESERTTRVQGNFMHGIVMDDIDCDGAKEILYQAADYNCYVHERGASVFELDSLKSKHNYLATYAADHFVPQGAFQDSLCSAGGFDEILADLSSLGYAVSEKERSLARVIYHRDISVKDASQRALVALRKTYLFQKQCLSVDVEISNRSSIDLPLRLVSSSLFQFGKNVADLEFFMLKGHEKTALANLESWEIEAAEALQVRGGAGNPLN